MLSILFTLLRALTAASRVYELNFSQGDLLDSWSYLYNSSTDGAFEYQPESIKLSSLPFTSWSGIRNSAEDMNNKLVLMRQNPIAIPADKIFTVEALVTGKTFGTELSPFPCNMVHPDDLRLASSSFSVLDVSSLFVFSFHLTNDRIYAVWSRPAAYRQAMSKNYPSFMYAVPIARRYSEDWHVLKLELNPKDSEVTWSVGSEPLLTIFHPERLYDRQYMLMDFGGDEAEAAPFNPEFVTLLLGTQTLLNAYAPCKDENHACTFPTNRDALVRAVAPENIFNATQYHSSSGAPSPAWFYEDTAENNDMQVWGQGAELQFKYIRASFV